MTSVQRKEMANRIKARRAALDYTQEAFAEAAGLSTSSYTKIENAFQNPGLDTLITIAEKLGVSLDYLVHGERIPSDVDMTSISAAIVDFADPKMLNHVRDVLGKIIKAKEN